MISINFYEIALQCINFIILIWLLKKFLTQPLSTFLKNRAQKLKHNLEQSEANKSETARLLGEQKELLKKSHQEAQMIRQKAEASSQKEKEQSVVKAKEEAKKLIDAAKLDIENEVSRAKQSLTEQVATLSIGVSEKIIQKNIDPAANRAIVDEYLKNKSS